MFSGPDEPGSLALAPPGFILLAHENLHRVAQLARFLALTGPVVIHVDRRSDRQGLTDLGPRVQVISTRSCEWGMMGLVDATLDAARILLSEKAEPVGHVCLLSGSCLPVRAPADLVSFLALHTETDFIEAVPLEKAQWVQGGLGAERFTLWFPFSWKRHRSAFDRLVELQRRVGISRKVPKDLEPRLGLQWWCLTAKTLKTLLAHPRLETWRRYFRHTWIPDEAFFQTIVPTLTRGSLQSSSLTLQRFDTAGKPFVFHDDHAELLERSGYFFARKIDPDAEDLYGRFLCDLRSVRSRFPGVPGKIDETPFEAARDRARMGQRGFLSASRLPIGTSITGVDTAQPYAVVVCKDGAILRRIRAGHMGTQIRFHGRLFGIFPTDMSPDFALRDGLGPGCLPTEQTQRDYRPVEYLTRLLWIGRDRPNAFLFSPEDNARVGHQIVSDWHARLILIGDQQDLIDRLRRPLTTKSGKPLHRAAYYAWVHAISPEEDDLEHRVLDMLGSDWNDPSLWVMPFGSKEQT